MVENLLDTNSNSISFYENILNLNLIQNTFNKKIYFKFYDFLRLGRYGLTRSISTNALRIPS